MRIFLRLIALGLLFAAAAASAQTGRGLPAEFAPTPLATEVARLKGVTIACLGGDAGGWAQLGLKVVPLQAGRPNVLPESVLQAEVLSLDWAYCSYTEADRDLLRRFLAAGKGLLLSAGVPAYLGSLRQDNLSCADFLGAKRYANFGGSITIASRNALTQDLDPLLVMRTPGGACGVLSEPTTATVVLNHQDLIVALANEYQGGRVFYCSETTRPWPGCEVPHSRLIQRALCWLAKR